jgi:hypothetical protein
VAHRARPTAEPRPSSTLRLAMPRMRHVRVDIDANAELLARAPVQ